MEDDKILTEKQTKQVTGGDGIVIINPGEFTPRCSKCGSTDVTLTMTINDYARNKKIYHYRCEKCGYTFEGEDYFSIDEKNS